LVLSTPLSPSPSCTRNSYAAQLSDLEDCVVFPPCRWLILFGQAQPSLRLSAHHGCLLREEIVWVLVPCVGGFSLVLQRRRSCALPICFYKGSPLLLLQRDWPSMDEEQRALMLPPFDPYMAFCSPRERERPRLLGTSRQHVTVLHSSLSRTRAF